MEDSQFEVPEAEGLSEGLQGQPDAFIPEVPETTSGALIPEVLVTTLAKPKIPEVPVTTPAKPKSEPIVISPESAETCLGLAILCVVWSCESLTSPVSLRKS